MRFKLILFLYLFVFITLTIFSYGFVDPNLELSTNPFYQKIQKDLAFLVYQRQPLTTLIFFGFILALFTPYFLLLFGKMKLSKKQLFGLIGVAVVILFLSYPAFSHDIFNYIMTAKVVTFYHENPYLIMPIEFIGEPMLAFMHAANKLALYAPFWIILTLIPSLLSKGNIFISIFLFKILVVLFYLGTIFLIWKILSLISPKEKIRGTIFFAFNPLVLMETLVSAHNDVVMAFFALLGLYLLFQKKKVFSFISLLASIGIKYATIVLLPIFAFSSRLKKEKIILFFSWALLFAFLLSPLREEIYPWYLIWALAFVALLPKRRFLFWLTVALSFGTLCRYLPFLYTRSWEGMTPMIKRWVTFVPPAIVIITFFLKQVLPRKFKL